MATRRTFLTTAAGIGGIVATPQILGAVTSGEPPLLPLLSKRSKENSYWYIGHLMSLLISSESTGGRYSLLRATERKGFEPPPHTHTREDETFLILEGEADYTVGGEQFPAKAGDVMFLPKNIQHSFEIKTEKLETLMLLTPGGFEKYFVEMSIPANELALPPIPQGPLDIQRILSTASRYGIQFAKP